MPTKSKKKRKKSKEFRHGTNVRQRNLMRAVFRRNQKPSYDDVACAVSVLPKYVKRFFMKMRVRSRQKRELRCIFLTHVPSAVKCLRILQLLFSRTDHEDLHPECSRHSFGEHQYVELVFASSQDKAQAASRVNAVASEHSWGVPSTHPRPPGRKPKSAINLEDGEDSEDSEEADYEVDSEEGDYEEFDSYGSSE